MVAVDDVTDFVPVLDVFTLATKLPPMTAVVGRFVIDGVVGVVAALANVGNATNEMATAAKTTPLRFTRRAKRIATIDLSLRGMFQGMVGGNWSWEKDDFLK
jgi:hypothetical protein